MKAAIYVRYSSDNQRSESIDAQIRAINEYASKNDITIVRTYIDEAKSATTDQRPEFLKMVDESKEGLFEAVIVHKLDRFARDRYDSIFYRRALKLNGVRLISVLENLDDSPESAILESVLEGMNEYYSRNLARETMKGLIENAHKCQHNGGIPPLGYNVGSDKKYVLNEEEADIVRVIFESYADGEGYGKIVDICNMRGYRTKRRNRFSKNSIAEILRNEKYLGIYVFNRESSARAGKRNKHLHKDLDEQIVIPGGMPQIIDEELWERVRRRMATNTRAQAKAIENYLLSGKVYCGKCGAPMIGNRRQSRGNYYISYECNNRKRTKQCDMKSISRDKLESAVLEQVNRLIVKNLDKLAEKVFFSMNEVDLKRSQALWQLNKDLKSVTGKIENMNQAILDGFYVPEMKEEAAKLQEQKAELQKEISIASKPREMTLEDVKEYIKSHIDGGAKNLIARFVDKVVVQPDSVDVYLVVDIDGGESAYKFRATTKLD
jgi:site-specific DNA recombinase